MPFPAPLRSFSRRLGCASVVAVLPLLTGGWGWLDGPQSVFVAKGPVADRQLSLLWDTIILVAVLFAIVGSLLAYCTIKFKARTDEDEHFAPPPQGHGNPLVEISLIGGSVLALVFIAVPTLKAIWYDYDVPAESRKDAIEIHAIGKQWWWKFEYPAETLDNGNPVTVANELVIPVGRAINVELSTDDVIHSFWVPRLAGKVNMIPNRANHLWLQADEAGYYWGQCAQFCGEDHAVMRFRVIALNASDYAAWVANQKKKAFAPDAQTKNATADVFPVVKLPRNSPGWSQAFDDGPNGQGPLASWQQQQLPAATLDLALVAKGRKLFADKTCITCHTVRGQEGVGTTAPDLTHVGARSTIAGGLLENNRANVYRWITDPPSVKPGNKMYMGIGGMQGYVKKDDNGDPVLDDHGDFVRRITINDEEARAIVEYIESLK